MCRVLLKFSFGVTLVSTTSILFFFPVLLGDLFILCIFCGDLLAINFYASMDRKEKGFF